MGTMTPMQAVVVQASSRRGGGGPDDGDATIFDAVTDLFGSDKWDLVLEVSPPGQPPFRHSGRYKISRRLGGLRAINKNWRPLPGLVVPVQVSADHRTVEIDWDAFVAHGGIDQGEQLVAARGAQQGASAMGKMLAKNPKLAAQQRAMALQHFPEQAVQVTTGILPADEFARSISSLVQGGALSQEEGDAFLRTAGLLPPAP